jgi:hypothetical protein
MPWVQPEEELEKLTQQNYGPRWDGTIVEIYDNDVHVRLTGTRQIKRNVQVADYIDRDKLRINMRVRLLSNDSGHPYLSAYFQPCDKRGGLSGPVEDCETPGRPAVTVQFLPGVIGIKDAWLVSWRSLDDVDYYVVYASQNPDGSGAVEIGSAEGITLEIPVDYLPSSDYRYFGVQAWQGDCSGAPSWGTGKQVGLEITVGEAITENIAQGHRIVHHDESSGCFFRDKEDSDWSTRNGSLSGDDIKDKYGCQDPLWQVRVQKRSSEDAILLKVNLGAVYRSEDGGQTWTDITPGTNPPNPGFDPAPGPTDVTYHLVDGTKFAEGTFFLGAKYDDTSLFAAWLLKTDDDGQTYVWVQVN